MIKYTAGFVDKLEDILNESDYRVRYERGNFQSGWCLLDHKRVVVLNKFLNVEGRVNTLVDLIPQLKIDFDKLTHSSQKIYDFLTANHLKKAGENTSEEQLEDEPTQTTEENEPLKDEPDKNETDSEIDADVVEKQEDSTDPTEESAEESTTGSK